MNERLINFNGKIHTFTQEERSKGGSRRSELKIFCSQVNAIKKGRYQNKLKYCDSCSIPLCPSFEKGKSCSVFNTKFVKLVMFKKNLSSIEEFDNYIFGFLLQGSKAHKTGSYQDLREFAHEMLAFREFKNESLR